jgi:hypothetical protein
MKNLSTTELLLILILLLELGLIIYLKQENNRLDEIHRSVFKSIATSSYRLGCLQASDVNIFLCEELTNEFVRSNIPNVELD